MIRILAAILLGAAPLTACASYPERAVVQGGELGGLTFSDAPAGAVVFINGQQVGSAQSFDGVNGVLELERGRYLVEVRAGGQVLLTREVYVGEAVADLNVQ
ncbi:MAG: hypothetical protein ACOC05_03395 [Oceanicaulis sp.]